MVNVGLSVEGRVEVFVILSRTRSKSAPERLHTRSDSGHSGSPAAPRPERHTQTGPAEERERERIINGRREKGERREGA